jgi:hypothetical protein
MNQGERRVWRRQDCTDIERRLNRSPMAAWRDAAYSGAVTQIDEARAFMIARTLIAQHGDQVASFLQAKIDALWASGDFEQLSAWFVIRNAVALTLESNTTSH